jgi:hypothetical protein
MNAEAFWSVIANYNSATIFLQFGLLLLLIAGCIAARRKVTFGYLPKVIYGAICLYMAGVFFLIYGTEPIQHFFAFPLFLLLGIVFLYEGIKNKADVFQRLTVPQWVLIALVALYPLTSVVQGKLFPEMLLYIMPCPVVCMGVILWLGYQKKNLFSLSLLTLWGLTGIKAFFFNAYEDIILLAVGIYALILLIMNLRRRAAENSTDADVRTM